MATTSSYSVGSAVTSRGVRKVNEQLVQDGRALLITEADEKNYDWEDIPNGSLKVDENNGVILVKLAGQTTWVPSNIRIDIPRDPDGNIIYDINNSEYGHTISIAKDAIIRREIYTIETVDNGDGTFYYFNENGDRLIGQISDRGHHFQLEKGHYAQGRNMLEVVIDDCLCRSAASGGLIEQSETKFILTEDLVPGMEITVKYYQLVRIGNPYPRIYLRRGEYGEDGVDTNGEPEAAEVGDIWIDFSGDPEADDGYLGEALGSSDYIPWWRIIEFPTTVAEAYSVGFMTDAEVKGHKHKASDITDLAAAIKSMKVGWADEAGTAKFATNAGTAVNALQLQGRVPGYAAGNIVYVDTNGKIPKSLIPDHKHNVSDIEGLESYVNSKIPTAVNGQNGKDGDKFPPGVIMAFWGSSIPSGWVECDGNNGTPDLRGRFLMCEGNGHGIGPGDCAVPNIWGDFSAQYHAEAHHYSNPSGGFTVSGLYSVGFAGGGNDDDDGGWHIHFDAKDCHPNIYKDVDEVLPRHFVIKFIMKI